MMTTRTDRDAKLAKNVWCRRKELVFLIAILSVTLRTFLSGGRELGSFFVVQSPLALESNHSISYSSAVEQEQAQDSAPLQALNNTNNSYFVVHVGPPKTGTTTVQLQLQNFSQILKDQDNCIYFHPSSHPVPLISILHNTQCHATLKEVREENEKTNSSQEELRNALVAVECWKPFVQELTAYRTQHNNHTSFIYSAEGFGIGGVKPTDWASLREILAHFDIELVVVITYRRYADWLLSSRKHQEKWTGRNPIMSKWPKQRGLRIQPFLPMVLKSTPGRSAYLPFRYTDFMLSSIAPHVPQTKILNMHTKHTIISTLLCDVFPNTPKTCEHSLQKDMQSLSEFKANNQESFRDSRKGSMQTITFYDRIATTASDQGLINISLISRRNAGFACQRFHEQVMRRKQEDLPLECPSQEHLQALLDESLEKEKALVPEFYAENEEEHRASFWKAANQNTFCTVNATAVLTNATWRDFLGSLGTENSPSA